MFNAVGRTVVVDEKNMDAVTGLSASGPAYAYIILESLAEAGVKVGLPAMLQRCSRAAMKASAGWFWKRAIIPPAKGRRNDGPQGWHHCRKLWNWKKASSA